MFALWAWNRYQPTTYTLEFVLCEWMVAGLLLDDALGWGVLGSVFEVYQPWPQPPPEARNRHEGNLSNSNNMCIMCSSISFSNNVFFEEPGNGINRACFGGYSTLRFVKIQPGHPGEFRTGENASFGTWCRHLAPQPISCFPTMRMLSLKFQ